MDGEITNKPLLLYAPIYDFVAEAFVDKMNDIPPDQDIEIWMNCPGGRVFAGWSIIGPLQMRTGKKTMCIFGHAMSMAVYMALFCDNVSALEVTQFMIHRADGYIETPEDKLLLDNINKDLRKQMESRLNMDVFQDVCGCSMDDIFKGENIKNVMLTAKQAKKLGLINSIKKLSQKEVEAYTDHFVAFADFSQRSEKSDSQRSDKKPETEIKNNSPKQITMTKEEIQAQHPAVYVAILKDGRDDGIKTERGRASAFLPFIDCDKDNVIKAIKEGKEFDNSVMAEMTVKLTAHVTKGNIEADKPEQIATAKVVNPDSPEAKKVKDFEAEVNKEVKNVKVF
ncbi:MAG: ATP-dependent Clp protease proteolytic subunit [Atribacterota bacterium]|nr:ATP-dependent Clp protease proteolytic subunit [Atribacterota bacterium]